MTMMFLLVILGRHGQTGATGFRADCDWFVPDPHHLISIPVTNTSVNPARSTGVAVFVGDWAD